MYGNRIHNVRDIFGAMEHHGDGDGLVSFEEFVEGLARLNIKPPRPQLLHAFEYMDDDHSGCIDWEEFNDCFGSGDGSLVLAKRKKHEQANASNLMCHVMPAT